MAKLKLHTSLAGEAFSHKPGTIIEVSDAEAARHVANGNGEIVVPDVAADKRAADGAETATATPKGETADATPKKK